MMPPTPPRFSLPRGEDYAALRDLFRNAGFTAEGIHGIFGMAGVISIPDPDVPRFLEQTRADRPLDVLVRLFILGVACERDLVRRVLAPLSLDDLAAAGLLGIGERSVDAEVKLFPLENLWIAADKPPEMGTGPHEDFVMSIGGSTLSLRGLTIRRPAGKALDLGTGCGAHALWAAPHSAQVTAIDRNPRAVDFARFNVRLNDIENVECLEGDLFGPVTGRRFDLILANPPFIISPVARLAYRDSGVRGDRFCRRLVRDAAAHLDDGGYVQIVANWPHEGDSTASLEEWFEGTGCDVWVLRSKVYDAPDYVTRWLKEEGPIDPLVHVERYQSWVRFLEEEKIPAVAIGVISMRRRSAGSNWFRLQDAPERLVGPCGEDVLRAFAIQDFLEAHATDSDLVEERLLRAPSVRLDETCEAEGGGWQVRARRLRLAEGIAHSEEVDQNVAHLALRCDGTRSLRELIAEMSASTGQPVDAVAPAVVEVARDLLRRGFLRPAAEDPR